MKFGGRKYNGICNIYFYQAGLSLAQKTNTQAKNKDNRVQEVPLGHPVNSAKFRIFSTSDWRQNWLKDKFVLFKALVIM